MLPQKQHPIPHPRGGGVRLSFCDLDTGFERLRGVSISSCMGMGTARGIIAAIPVIDGR